MDICIIIRIHIDTNGKIQTGLREALEFAGLDKTLGFELAGGIEPVGPYLNAEEAVLCSENYRAAKNVLILRIEKENTVRDFDRLYRLAMVQPEQAADFAEWSFENPDMPFKVEAIPRRQKF